MELPEDLPVIKEYSMHVTRSDWRYLHRMTYSQYVKDLYIAYKKREYIMMYKPDIYRKTGIHNIFSEYNYGRIMFHI